MKNKQPRILGIRRIEWNFEKFLIKRDGAVKKKWSSISKLESLEATIVEKIRKAKL